MVLRKPLNKVKWFAVILLTNGAAQYQLSSCSGGGLKTSTYGLTVMAVIVGCAFLSISPALQCVHLLKLQL